MRNDDIKKITEIKQYLLDPPVSFKLYDYALIYLGNTINILKKYPESKELIEYLQNLMVQFDNKQINPATLNKTLKEAGAAINKLTSKVY